MGKGIKELFIDELHDILSAENQIVKALPGMVTAAESPALKKAFKTHLNETKGQIKRLEKIFKLLKVKEKEKFCHGAKGLIEECKQVFKDYEKSILRDAAIISKAQRVEHYEISAYGTLRTLAKRLDLAEAAKLLQDTLNEEGHADKTLTIIAESRLLNSIECSCSENTPNKSEKKKVRAKKPVSRSKPVRSPKKTKKRTSKR